MHLALKAYHELLNCLSAMDQSTDAAVRNSAQVIKGTTTGYLADVDTGVSFVRFHRDIFCWQLKSVLHGSASPYLGPLVPVCSLLGRRSLHSTGTNHLLVPSVKRSTVGCRAFPVAGPKTWNALPEDVTSSLSEYIFCHQLKTWLFKKSFPDIII